MGTWGHGGEQGWGVEGTRRPRGPPRVISVPKSVCVSPRVPVSIGAPWRVPDVTVSIRRRGCVAVHVSPGVLSVPKGVWVSPGVLEVLVAVRRSLQVTVLPKDVVTLPTSVRLSPQVLSVPMFPRVPGVPVSVHL